MKEYLEVDGYPGLVRDPENNAILNVDFEKIAAARKRKAEKHQRRQEKMETETRMTQIENDLSEIKDVLKLLLEKNL
jgi:hypothetical protein